MISRTSVNESQGRLHRVQSHVEPIISLRERFTDLIIGCPTQCYGLRSS